MKNEIESWHDIPGYGNTYQISDMGNVRNLRFNKIKVLKPGIIESGYRQVVLCNKGTKKTIKVSVIVAIVFYGHVPNESRLVVDHKDFNKLNDRKDNIQVITHRHNLSKDTFRKNPSSLYTGVSWHKQHKKWISNIRICGKLKFLGYFNTEIEAYNRYKTE